MNEELEVWKARYDLRWGRERAIGSPRSGSRTRIGENLHPLAAKESRTEETIWSSYSREQLIAPTDHKIQPVAAFA